MATFNKSTKGSWKTENKSGHKAYRLDDKTKLMTMALTTMLNEKKFYGDNTDELIQLAEDMCSRGGGEFVSKLAVWAREKGNLRSVSHAMIAVAARNCSGSTFIRPAAGRIASMRGDDGTEMIATYLALYGKPINHAFMRGIKDALEESKPFSIAKYQSKNREVKLRDTLRLTHPRALMEATSDAMGQCIAGTLGMPKGWETELSARGNSKEVWDELIAEKKLGYMTMLRNLRNMVKAGADIDPVLTRIADHDAVIKSRQLPFRFYSAYRELVNAGIASTKVVRALDAAMIAACENVDRLPGKTAVLIDTSGSMGQTISAKSTVSCGEIAAVLGAMATHISDDAWVAKFDYDSKVIPMTGLSVIGDVTMVPISGGCTNMAAGFAELVDSAFDADRIIVLSDNEVNSVDGWYYGHVGFINNKELIQNCLAEYRKKVGHDVWCHAIDLMGYGTAQFMGDKVNIMAGWSDNVLKFINLAENGFGGIVKDVEGIVL